jgi:oligopeptide transport system ATP-binding protein
MILIMSDVLLKVDNLKVSFFTPAGEVKAVDGISYDLERGEVLGIVGESGSGKSVEAYTIMGLVKEPGRVVGGNVSFEGEDLLAFNERRMREFRGSGASIVFQNPMTSLNPVYTIGNQLTEALLCHDTKVTQREAADQAMMMLDAVGINNVDKRMKQYPHEISGGMRQRVMIAMALIRKPKILIADEPTTALDVTVQAQILELLKDMQEKTGMAILFITHNLGVVAEMCERVMVMYAGKVVEEGTVSEIFYSATHPYTQGLMLSMPRVDLEFHERLIPIEGTPVDMLNLPAGCRFAPRCKYCLKLCLRQPPPVSGALGEQHKVSCWMYI